ncbi:MAG: hypothetical protein J7K54_01420 [Candidatus Aenigmarchaeota archaeon]|nr:hypothetical protein [Candidatus Aenigmarchaeota archaeon]
MVLLCIPCLALLIYFLIASIFFPKYRRYVREGWRCFTDKIRGKKCAVSFDNRMRMAFSAWLTEHRMVRLGRWFSSERNFNWFLIIATVVSTLLTLYLFVLFIHFQINPPCAVGDVCSIDM